MSYTDHTIPYRENDPSELELTFSVEQEEFGVTKEVELKAGGKDIPVYHTMLQYDTAISFSLIGDRGEQEGVHRVRLSKTM